jgi:hypothetical protein
MSALTASLSYMVPTTQKPVYIASQGGAQAQLSISVEFEDRAVKIHDARQLLPSASLDQQGFTLCEQTTSIEDFYRLDEIRAAYETELKALLSAQLGTSDILIFDHTLRSSSADIREQRSTREPAGVIHNDYTDASAVKRVRDLLGVNEAAERLSRPYAIVNTWRSISGPVINNPLCCCDATTIASQDLIATERRAEERIGELELVTWNPAHRWYYYPQMQRDEVLLIKTFDSRTDGRARRSIHSAFDNPLAPTNAPPRESIESRALIFYQAATCKPYH